MRRYHHNKGYEYKLLSLGLSTVNCDKVGMEMFGMDWLEHDRGSYAGCE